MKFTTFVNGAEKNFESVNSDLRAGFMLAVDNKGEQKMIVSPEQFHEIINTYVDTLVKHGVRSFVYAYEKAGKIEYYRLTPATVKKNAQSLYSFNTDGKFLSLCYRATKTEIACLQTEGKKIMEAEAEELQAVQEQASLGYKAEVLLYGKAQHKKTYSDGKSYNHNGKKENSQLKASCRNSSRSRSKTHNIWSARYTK